ncbi:MAG: thioredoxin [Clostridia bacterium]|nr:thioredoxin [Clostridia bacterium]
MTALTKENFKFEVEEYKGLVVIDLWATWCGPCVMLAPRIEELEREMPDVKFCKIDVDDQRELAMQFKVESIPMIAVVKDNTFLDFSVGYVPKERLEKMINQYR